MNLSPINNGLPYLQSDFYRFSNIPEHTDSDAGDGIGIAIGTVQASDQDNDPLLFTLTGPYAYLFEITTTVGTDSSVGEIVTARALDYEVIRRSSMPLTVRVQDRPQGHEALLDTFGTVIVSIYDVNDHAPVFDGSEPRGGSIFETDPPGTQVHAVSAIDGDANRFNSFVTSPLCLTRRSRTYRSISRPLGSVQPPL